MIYGSLRERLASFTKHHVFLCIRTQSSAHFSPMHHILEMWSLPLYSYSEHIPVGNNIVLFFLFASNISYSFAFLLFGRHTYQFCGIKTVWVV